MCRTLALGLSMTWAALAAAPTPIARGPFHVAGNQILNASGTSFLLRGTQTTPFRLSTAAYDARSTVDFGPHSATSFSAIRLRMNMNAIRIPVYTTESNNPHFFPELERLVNRANANDLLVVLAATPSRQLLPFWTYAAALFKNNPNILFDAVDSPPPSNWATWRHDMEAIVQTIRATGARQPIILASPNDSHLFQGFDPSAASDSNLIYEVAPRYETTRTDSDRDAQFGFLAATVPVIANDWDLHLDDPQSCRAIPPDTDGATRLILDNFTYFDSHRISWTVSTYTQGRLLEDTVNLISTKLESGITCGEIKGNVPGMGRLVLSHMFGTDEGKLVVVNTSGSISLARGGYGIVYGRIMSDHDANDPRPLPAFQLGGLSVKITDSHNITRPARISWASAGWGNVNFVVPELSATGPATLTLERADGSRDTAAIDITSAAPGLYTAMNCQGPALGSFTQSTRHGRRIASASISQCKGSACTALPIPVSSDTQTIVTLPANGFRHASPSAIEVTIAGVRVPVLSYGPAKAAGVDNLTIAIPPSLRGAGETDLVCHVNGRLANVVRIAIGS